MSYNNQIPKNFQDNRKSSHMGEGIAEPGDLLTRDFIEKTSSVLNKDISEATPIRALIGVLGCQNWKDITERRVPIVFPATGEGFGESVTIQTKIEEQVEMNPVRSYFNPLLLPEVFSSTFTLEEGLTVDDPVEGQELPSTDDNKSVPMASGSYAGVRVPITGGSVYQNMLMVALKKAMLVVSVTARKINLESGIADMNLFLPGMPQAVKIAFRDDVSTVHFLPASQGRAVATSFDSANSSFDAVLKVGKDFQYGYETTTALIPENKRIYATSDGSKTPLGDVLFAIKGNNVRLDVTFKIQDQKNFAPTQLALGRDLV